MSEEKKKRFAVTIGEFDFEQSAMDRVRASRQAGFNAKVIDREDTALTDVVTALTLIAVKLDKLIKAVGNREVIVKEDEPKSLGEFLRAKRKKAGMLAKEVAEGLNVTTNSIYQYENDKVFPNMKKLKYLAELYDFNINDALVYLN